MYKTDVEKLKDKINKKNISFQVLSDNMGIDRATLYRRLQNNRLRISDMQTLTAMLGLTKDEATDIFLAS